MYNEHRFSLKYYSRRENAAIGLKRLSGVCFLKQYMLQYYKREQ